MTQNAKENLITQPPARSLFFFALPMIIGNLFQQFYNMADSIIVGNLVGEDALAAVGASYSFTTVFIMIAIGGGIGASVLASQYLGAGHYREMKSSVYTFLRNCREIICIFLESMLIYVMNEFSDSGGHFHGT